MAIQALAGAVGKAGQAVGKGVTSAAKSVVKGAKETARKGVEATKKGVDATTKAAGKTPLGQVQETKYPPKPTSTPLGKAQEAIRKAQREKAQRNSPLAQAQETKYPPKPTSTPLGKAQEAIRKAQRDSPLAQAQETKYPPWYPRRPAGKSTRLPKATTPADKATTGPNKPEATTPADKNPGKAKATTGPNKPEATTPADKNPGKAKATTPADKNPGKAKATTGPNEPEATTPADKNPGKAKAATPADKATTGSDKPKPNAEEKSDKQKAATPADKATTGPNKPEATTPADKNPGKAKATTPADKNPGKAKAATGSDKPKPNAEEKSDKQKAATPADKATTPADKNPGKAKATTGPDKPNAKADRPKDSQRLPLRRHIDYIANTKAFALRKEDRYKWKAFFLDFLERVEQRRDARTPKEMADAILGREPLRASSTRDFGTQLTLQEIRKIDLAYMVAAALPKAFGAAIPDLTPSETSNAGIKYVIKDGLKRQLRAPLDLIEDEEERKTRDAVTLDGIGVWGRYEDPDAIVDNPGAAEKHDNPTRKERALERIRKMVDEFDGDRRTTDQMLVKASKPLAVFGATLPITAPLLGLALSPIGLGIVSVASLGLVYASREAKRNPSTQPGGPDRGREPSPDAARRLRRKAKRK